MLDHEETIARLSGLAKDQHDEIQSLKRQLAESEEKLAKLAESTEGLLRVNANLDRHVHALKGKVSQATVHAAYMEDEGAANDQCLRDIYNTIKERLGLEDYDYHDGYDR